MANPDITIFDENDTGSSTEPPTEIMEDGFYDGYIPPATDHNFLFKQNQDGLIKSRNDGVWDWEDPAVNTDITYSIGSIVRHSNRAWISKVNTNTGEPGVTGWFLAPRQELETRTVTHDMASDANYTLTEPQNSYGRVIITDTGVILTTGRNIIVDDNERIILVQNDTAQILTFKTAAGTGIDVNAGETATLLCNGTDVIYAIAPSSIVALACSGYLTTDISAVDTVFNWTETLDTDNALTSGVFTVPAGKAGKLVIIASITHKFIGGAAFSGYYVYHNAASLVLKTVYDENLAYPSTPIALVVNVAAGDTIKFQTHETYCTSTARIRGDASRETHFSIYYLGE